MNVTDITVPSSRLPNIITGLTEGSHIREDANLWNFVAFVYAFSNGNNTKERFLRKEAKKFLDWNDKHDDRTQWYA